MLRDNLRNNHISLIGKLAVPPLYVCEHNGVKYYDGLVKYNRQHGSAFDMIPITTDERTARAIQRSDPIEDASIVIDGHIVSRGNNLRSQTGLEYPMAVEIEDVCFNLGKWTKPMNDVEIKGYICENPICRATPSGQEICELTIAVPKDAKRDGAQNYIKCITWNGTARFASKLYIGAFVEGLGRFQSRMYTKRLDNGKTVQRYAYEVSLYVMADGRI